MDSGPAGAPEASGARSSAAPLIAGVALKNFKSIAACDVELAALTFLVGPNGSGKSNFVDALRLTNEALRTTLDHALQERGGIQEVRRRSTGHPTHFGVRLRIRLPDGSDGSYRYEIGARAGGGYVVRVEECSVGSARYLVRDGVVAVMTEGVSPPAYDDRLYLVTASGLPAFRVAYEALSRMGFYNINPDQIRALQKGDPGEVLSRDGRNIASILERLAKDVNGDAGVKRRIEEYLARVVGGIEGVDCRRIDAWETIEFRQRVGKQKDPWQFRAINMSDGTLRALGNLVALFQGGRSRRVPLVAIEEPEVALHPAAAGVLLDALREASARTQVLVTSHSPELLDSDQIDDRQILAVASADGRTEIGRIDEAGRAALRRQLYTAGELLRHDQLRPEPGQAEAADRAQRSLFDEDP